jgi:hypothetical protein
MPEQDTYLAQIVHQRDQARAEVGRLRLLLRAAEDELTVHRQRAATRPVETRPLAEPALTVRMMTPPLPACPDCQKPRHAEFTCEEMDALAIALGRAFTEAYERTKGPHLGAAFTAPLPESCSGCGSGQVVYRNYLGQPLCCACAACCKPAP